jgi:pimeloyl-ACP methyl ester carboxylesterase
VNPESIQLELGALRFDALAAGPDDGELVLLCHGFPTTSHCWFRLMPSLATAGYRAVAADGRGLSPGARPARVGDYAIEHLVADVIGFADQLGAERFHLVGHDWGGLQGWQVAGRYPARVATLTILSTPHNRAFREALEDDDDDQRGRSAYFETFRTPGAGEDMWLAGGADGLREMYRLAGLQPEEFEPYVAALSDRAALTGDSARSRCRRSTAGEPKIRRSDARPRSGLRPGSKDRIASSPSRAPDTGCPSRAARGSRRCSSSS